VQAPLCITSSGEATVAERARTPAPSCASTEPQALRTLTDDAPSVSPCLCGEKNDRFDQVFRLDFGTDAFAAGVSLMGRVFRHLPSWAWSAPATAPAVGTRPISPTPLEP